MLFRGLANVVKNGACAVLGADQLHVGISDRPSMWWLVNHQDPEKNINQLKVPTEAGDVPRFSSQLITRVQCKKSRSKIQQDALFSAFSDLGKLRVLENYKKIPSSYVYHYKTIANKMENITQWLSTLSCEQAGLPQHVCDAKVRILNDRSGTEQKYLSDLDNMFFAAFDIYNKIETMISAKLSDATDDIAKKVRLRVSGDVAPNFGDWSPPKGSKEEKEQEEVHRLTNELLPPVNLLKQQQNTLWAQAINKLHQFQRAQSFQDWVDVYECFLPDRFDDIVVGYSSNVDASYWDDIARRSAPLSFTEKDYSAARQCEAGIAF